MVFTWGKHKNKARKVKVFKVQVSAVTSLNMRSSLKSVFFFVVLMTTSHLSARQEARTMEVQGWDSIPVQQLNCDSVHPT